jgi:hypothetical protein
MTNDVSKDSRQPTRAEKKVKSILRSESIRLCDGELCAGDKAIEMSYIEMRRVQMISLLRHAEKKKLRNGLISPSHLFPPFVAFSYYL